MVVLELVLQAQAEVEEVEVIELLFQVQVVTQELFQLQKLLFQLLLEQEGLLQLKVDALEQTEDLIQYFQV